MAMEKRWRFDGRSQLFVLTRSATSKAVVQIVLHAFTKSAHTFVCECRLVQNRSLEQLDGGCTSVGGLRFDLELPDEDEAVASCGVAVLNLEFTSAELPRIF